MQVIDEFFYRIHPRSVTIPASVGARPNLPVWLKESRDRRYLYGHYAETEEKYLIPRGPLLRVPREESASNAETLADHYTALTVVSRKLNQENRPIRIKPIFIGTDSACGVAPGSNPGEEKVTFIPIAEDENDLVATEKIISNQKFFDFQINSALDPADRLMKVLNQSHFSDIAIAPEMVMPEIEADKLPDKLLSLKAQPSRLIISGSGSSIQTTDEGLAWNETRVLNGFGAELWRQRKIWTAGLTRDRAMEYGFSDPGKGLVMEYNVEGNEVVVADADGLGRCVVLICQDIQASPLSAELISQFQPDWVFIPILDPSIRVGGWGHQRVFALSELSQARFLIASSTALARKIGVLNEPFYGLAVGPKSTYPEIQGRVYNLVGSVTKSSPGYATIHWQDAGTWKKTTVS